MKGILGIGMAILAAASVSVATIGVASAQAGGDETARTRHGYVGVVTEASTSTRTLVVQIKAPEGATSSPEAITFQLTDDTRIKTPGAASKTRVGGVLEPGARVAILGETQPNGTWTAIQVLVKPNAPTMPPVTGSVASVENGIMTLMLPNGKVKTIEVGGGQDAPDVGEVVTVFAPEVEDGERPAKAKGLVKAAEVHERLKKFLDETEADRSDLAPSVKSHRVEVAAKLADLIEKHAAHRVQVLDRVLSREGFPEKARSAVERAFQNAKTKQSEAESKADGARDRLDIPKGKSGQSGQPGNTGPRATPTGRPGQSGGR